MRLIVPNLTFEDDLAERRAKVSVHAQRALKELAPLMGHVANNSDLVVVPEVPRSEDLPDSLRHVRFCTLEDLHVAGAADATSILPWGWTQPLRSMATGLEFDLTHVPSASSVYEVNSRRFNARHDVLLAVDDGMFGLLCDSTDAWADGVRVLQDKGYNRWVTKPQISRAGRNRLLGSGCDLNDQQRGWLNKQLLQSGGVYLEPWVQVIDECGLQFEIAGPENGSQADFVGIAQLINDDVGRYHGSLIAADGRLEESWQAAISHGLMVCRAAQTAGYWGPLGIDAFRFALPSGEIAMRVSNDLNGRFTMGRVALHLRKCLQSGEYGLWTHYVVPADSLGFAAHLETFSDLEAIGVRTVATSPLEVAGGSVRQGTALLIGQSRAQLLEVAQKIQNR